MEYFTIELSVTVRHRELEKKKIYENEKDKTADL